MASEFEKEIDDLCECPICCELFKKPKVLPCVHTFCLKCLQEYTKAKKPGDEADCPTCRTKFNVPAGGVDTLPGNFFIDKLATLKKSAVKELRDLQVRRMCDICSEENESNPSKYAKWICSHCDENLCDQCAENHWKLRSTSIDELVEIGSNTIQSLFLNESKLAVCVKHPNSFTNIFCDDCKKAICEICQSDEHETHRVDDVYKTTEEFRRKLLAEVDRVRGLEQQFRNEADRSWKEREQFLESFHNEENSISSSVAQLIDIVKKKGSDLFHELKCLQVTTVQEFAMEEAKIQHRLGMVKSLIIYSQEVVEKASPSDIAQRAQELYVRTKELTSTTLARSVPILAVKFVPSDIAGTLSGEDLTGNVLGSIARVEIETLPGMYFK